MYDDIYDELLAMLQPLARVTQPRRHHPEGDALFHSLQVFQLARDGVESPLLWVAALLHDVGKAEAGRDHAEVGAEMLEGLVRPELCWLVAHHLDLLREPKETRRVMRDDPRLVDLERLRRFDVGGRRPDARAPSVERVLGELLEPGVAEHWLADALVAVEA